MSIASAIALSGAVAQTQRLAGSAGNVANARSIGALPAADGTVPADKRAPYQPLTGDQVAVVGPDGQGQGTRTIFRPSNPGYLPEYQPDSPQADAEGMVAAPNVDLAAERVDQIGALQAYKANLAVLRTEDEMQQALLRDLA